MKCNLVSFFVIITVTNAVKLPSFFPKCSKTDVKLTECITKSANEAWPTMIQGDKSSHIRVLVPFFVPLLTLNVGTTLTGHLTNATLNGLAKTKFSEVNLDLNKKQLDVKFLIPQLSAIGNYQVSGRLLFLPLEGQGPANITYNNMKNDLHIEYKLNSKGNNQYIEIKQCRMKFTLTRAYFKLNNLFGGDAKLGEAMNKVLDESWEAVNDEVGARIGDAVGAAFCEVLQSFFNKVSITEFFTE